MSKSLVGIIVIVAIIAVVIGGVVLVGYKGGDLFSGNNGTDEQGKRPELDPNQGEYVPPEATASSGGIAIPGWDSITLPAGQRDVTVDFPNPAANDGKYYLTFELRLKATGEVLYTSGMVSPGLHIQRITLARALEVGTYDAVIHVQPYKMDKALTATNNADMETKLIVV